MWGIGWKRTKQALSVVDLFLAEISQKSTIFFPGLPISSSHPLSGSPWHIMDADPSGGTGETSFQPAASAGVAACSWMRTPTTLFCRRERNSMAFSYGEWGRYTSLNSWTTKGSGFQLAIFGFFTKMKKKTPWQSAKGYLDLDHISTWKLSILLIQGSGTIHPGHTWVANGSGVVRIGI